MVDVRTPDRVGRIVSVVLWLRLMNPSYPNRIVRRTVTDVVQVTGLRVHGWVDGSDGDGNNRVLFGGSPGH